jgi:hypothetical protein
MLGAHRIRNGGLPKMSAPTSVMAPSPAYGNGSAARNESPQHTLGGKAIFQASGNIETHVTQDIVNQESIGRQRVATTPKAIGRQSALPASIPVKHQAGIQLEIEAAPNADGIHRAPPITTGLKTAVQTAVLAESAGRTVNINSVAAMATVDLPIAHHEKRNWSDGLKHRPGMPTAIFRKPSPRSDVFQIGKPAIAPDPPIRSSAPDHQPEAGKPALQRSLIDLDLDHNTFAPQSNKSDLLAYRSPGVKDIWIQMPIEKIAVSQVRPAELLSFEDSAVESRLIQPFVEMDKLSDAIEKAVWRQANGQQQIRIQLKPAFLGQLHLNVSMEQLKVSVEIRAETILARDVLEMNLTQLKTELQHSGLDVDKIDVLVDPDPNNPPGQHRDPVHRQALRRGGDLKAPEPADEENMPEPESIALTRREEGRINCFI